jgi:hypothetical protein
VGYISGNWLYYQGDMDDGPNKLYRMSLDGQVRDFIYYVLKNEEYHYDGNVDGIIFAAKINALLDNSVLSVYCYGSATYDDFHIGYSDLDFFAIIDKAITEEDFQRQTSSTGAHQKTY